MPRGMEVGKELSQSRQVEELTVESSKGAVTKLVKVMLQSLV